MSQREVWITGIGVVTAAGIGIDAFRTALRAGPSTVGSGQIVQTDPPVGPSTSRESSAGIPAPKPGRDAESRARRGAANRAAASLERRPSAHGRPSPGPPRGTSPDGPRRGTPPSGANRS